MSLPTLYSDGIYKARKPHRCCECGATILPGQEYFRADGLWEGSFDHYKRCLPCVELADEVLEIERAGRVHEEEMTCFGYLFESAHEYGILDEWKRSKAIVTTIKEEPHE